EVAAGEAGQASGRLVGRRVQLPVRVSLGIAGAVSRLQGLVSPGALIWPRAVVPRRVGEAVAEREGQRLAQAGASFPVPDLELSTDVGPQRRPRGDVARPCGVE